MKKYKIDLLSNLGSINTITLKRVANGIKINNDADISISGWPSDVSKYGNYNNKNLYLYRKINILPESTDSNTLITNDGLIGIFYTINDNYYATIVDIFEQDSTIYENIVLNDFDSTNPFTEEDNPFNKRIFICTGSGGELPTELSTTNREIYRNGTSVYFESDMDYNLPRTISDTENGYYIISNASPNYDWDNIYKTPSIFQFYKRQLFIIIGPNDLEIELDSDQENITLSKTTIESGKYLLDLRYLEISDDINQEDKFVRLKFKSVSTYCYIIVY